MKLTRYSHAPQRPLMVELARQIDRFLRRHLAPVLSRLMPGRRGRRIIGVTLVLVGLVVQVILLWLLTNLVELCIQLFDLWAFLANEFVKEI